MTWVSTHARPGASWCAGRASWMWGIGGPGQTASPSGFHVSRSADRDPAARHRRGWGRRGVRRGVVADRHHPPGRRRVQARPAAPRGHPHHVVLVDRHGRREPHRDHPRVADADGQRDDLHRADERQVRRRPRWRAAAYLRRLQVGDRRGDPTAERRAAGYRDDDRRPTQLRLDGGAVDRRGDGGRCGDAAATAQHDRHDRRRAVGDARGPSPAPTARSCLRG